MVPVILSKVAKIALRTAKRNAVKASVLKGQ